MTYYIGVDIGATKIAAALISEGKIVKKTIQPTEAKKSPAIILANIKNAIREIYSPAARGIGIGIAGAISQQNGLVISSPNFSKNFKNIPLQKIIEQAFKKPVLINNDARCFTLGEAVHGAGKNYRFIVGLTLGTGIGGGIIIDKKIYSGSLGLAGELGHINIIQAGRKCSCGQKGHLEAYASGRAMIKLYKELTGRTKDTFIIEKLALQKDKKALAVFKIMSRALATGLATIINGLNPDIIILGGGISKVPLLIKAAVKLAKKQVVYPELAQTKIVTSRLKENAALLGAVALFKN
ncbi:MAG: ROK family protein [Patescibacteria group bacterium]|jgi:glucokinase